MIAAIGSSFSRVSIWTPSARSSANSSVVALVNAPISRILFAWLERDRLERTSVQDTVDHLDRSRGHRPSAYRRGVLARRLPGRIEARPQGGRAFIVSVSTHGKLLLIAGGSTLATAPNREHAAQHLDMDDFRSGQLTTIVLFYLDGLNSTGLRSGEDRDPVRPRILRSTLARLAAGSDGSFELRHPTTPSGRTSTAPAAEPQ